MIVETYYINKGYIKYPLRWPCYVTVYRNDQSVYSICIQSRPASTRAAARASGSKLRAYLDRGVGHHEA